ncbi:MAG: c-type cytochrome biogenesis protein CcmI [Methylophilaceae bacterium]
MLVFWLVVVVLILVSLGFILPSLLKPKAYKATDAQDEKRAIFSQQFDEIEQDKRNGVLDATQFQVAKSELERRMLDEIGGSAVVIGLTKPDYTLAIVLTVLLPVLSILIYLKIGHPAAVTIPVLAPNAVSSLSEIERSAANGDVEPLLNALKTKLDEHPENGEGWALLARTYAKLNRHAEAVDAFEKATQAIKDNSQLYADYADALGMANGRSLDGKPKDLINKALALDPNNTKALMLAGSAAYDDKNFKQAIQHWEHLQKVLPADSDLLPDIKAALSETYQLVGESPLVAPAQTLKESLPITATGSIMGTVSISQALASQVSPNDTLFILARPTHRQAMPYAVIKVLAKDLPYQFKLDDSLAIMPNHKLSQADEVVLVARVSKHGGAESQSGDLQGVSATIKPAGEAVNIEINEVVK